LARQLMLDAKLLYTWKEHYHPFIMAGAGIAFNNAYNYNTNADPSITLTRHYTNQVTSAFTYALGFGLDIDMSPTFRLGVNYRFTDTGNTQLGRASIDSVPVAGTLSQSSLYAHQILVQATALFN